MPTRAHAALALLLLPACSDYNFSDGKGANGEADDTVPLSAVMDWARPQTLPVTVIPGGGHFFHGQLPLLKSLVLRHLSGFPGGSPR